jgi:hypothetical protein
MCLAGFPESALAQSAIAGVVKDASGGVLPGVTVEATSDALIEKSRSVITDGAGQYRIIDLRPGTYVLTFTLTGFQTVRRGGVELPAEFTATINADMRVGSIEETITVTGASPVVDIANAVQITRLDRETLDLLPTGQNIWEMGQLIPGINLSTPSVGGQGGASQTYMSVHGMSAAQNVVMVDGMTVSGLEANGSVQAYFNQAMNQDVSYQTSGIGADRSGGGVTVNMIPREGGNRFSGDTRISYRPGEWLGDNFTSRLADMGMTFVNSLEYLSDVTVSQGGPLRRDKFWFFTSYHQFDTRDLVSNTVFDDGSQGSDQQSIKQGLLRLTYQLNSSTKVSGFYDRAFKTRSHAMGARVDPETASSVWSSPNYSTGTFKVTSTLTNRLLLEGGYSQNREFRNVFAQEGILKPRWSAEWYANPSTTTNEAGGGRTTAPSLPGQDWPGRDNLQGSLSYVTGSHSFKAGVQYQWGRFFHSNDANADLTRRFDTATLVGNNWVFATPVDVQVRNTPIASIDRLNRDVGIYAQDSWKLRRLTINAGLRWEHVNAQNDAYSVPAGRFTPARSIPAVKDVPNWFDWAPRFSVVYDLFGNAKTALKYSINRYNRSAATALAYSYNTLTSTTRTLAWTDVNGDLLPQGQVEFNPDGTPKPFCSYPSLNCEINLAPLLSANGTFFGTPDDADTYHPYDRTWNLEQIIELQHEVLPRLSVTTSLTRGSDRNLTRTINRFRREGDYLPYTIYNPETGTPFIVYGIKDTATRDRLAQGNSNITINEPDMKSIYNQFAIEFRARPYPGASIFGGYTAARELDRSCGAPSRPDLVVSPNDFRFCDEFNLEKGHEIPFAQDFRLGIALPLPYGVTLGATYLNNDEGGFAPVWTFTATTTYPDGSPTSTRTIASKPAPACPSPCTPGGRTVPAGFIFASGTTSLSPQLYPSGAVKRYERNQQLDLKISRTFRTRGLTIAPTLELFNALNTDTILGYESTAYATVTGTYLVPDDILLGRVVGVGVHVKW